MKFKKDSSTEVEEITTEVQPEKASKNCNVKEKITLKAIKQNLELASELICFCNNCLDNMVNEGDDTCETSCED